MLAKLYSDFLQAKQRELLIALDTQQRVPNLCNCGAYGCMRGAEPGPEDFDQIFNTNKK